MTSVRSPCLMAVVVWAARDIAGRIGQGQSMKRRLQLSRLPPNLKQIHPDLHLSPNPLQLSPFALAPAHSPVADRVKSLARRTAEPRGNHE